MEFESLHCIRCVSTILIANIGEIPTNRAEFHIHRSQAIKLKVKNGGLVHCENCSLPLGITIDNIFFIIDAEKTITLITRRNN